MATITRSPAEARLAMRLTLLVGGIGIALGSALPLLYSLTSGLNSVGPQSLLNPVRELAPFLPYASTLILCAALLVLAYGLPGESGIAGRSVVARVALTALAIQILLARLDSLLLANMSEFQAMSLSWYYTGSYLLGVVAALVAVFAVQRAGVLSGFLLAATLVVVLMSIGLPLILSAWMSVIGLDQAQSLAEAWSIVGSLIVVAQIALGVLYALAGFRMRPPAP